MSDSVKYLLNETDIPQYWYNISADLPVPLPPVLHPGTKQPITPDDLAPIFPISVIEQEVSQERYLDIPEEAEDVYRLWRPTPLVRARHSRSATGSTRSTTVTKSSAARSASRMPRRRRCTISVGSMTIPTLARTKKAVVNRSGKACISGRIARRPSKKA